MSESRAGQTLVTDYSYNTGRECKDYFNVYIRITRLPTLSDKSCKSVLLPEETAVSPRVYRRVHCKMLHSLLLYTRHLDRPPPIRLLLLVLALAKAHSPVTNVVDVAALVDVAVVLSFS